MGYAALDTYKTRYRTDPTTYFRRVRHNQIKTSKVRVHTPPDYTLEELITWLELQPHLTQLWTDWQASGHQRNLAPSLDRLDDSLPYTLNNIRLVTWAENLHKSHRDIRAGKVNKNSITSSKPLKQYTKDGVYLTTFTSSGHAEEALGLRRGARTNIRAAASGKLKTAYGYIWREP